MKQTSLQGIANKATQDKTYRFRNLFGLLTTGFLFWCWDFINRKAIAGIDGLDAQAYEEDLLPNIEHLIIPQRIVSFVGDKWIPLVVKPKGTRFGAWNYNTNHEIGSVGDFNGDGKDDLVVRSGWGIGILTLNSQA